MAPPHSSILAWRNPTDRGAWWAAIHGVTRVEHNLATTPPPPITLWPCDCGEVSSLSRDTVSSSINKRITVRMQGDYLHGA